MGNAANQESGGKPNNRAENSRQPFRRWEKAMSRFRNIGTLQKFTSADASIHNLFSHERHLKRGDMFKHDRVTVLVGWC